MLSCTHLYHLFPVSIHYLQCIQCLLHQTLAIYFEELIDADTWDYHHNINLLQYLKVVGTQLYPGSPLHRPEETSMIPRPIVYGAW